MAAIDQDIFPEHPATTAASVSRWWAARPLHHRFAIAGSAVTFIGVAVIGTLVSKSIETGVVRNSAIPARSTWKASSRRSRRNWSTPSAFRPKPLPA